MPIANVLCKTTLHATTRNAGVTSPQVEVMVRQLKSKDLAVNNLGGIMGLLVFTLGAFGIGIWAALNNHEKLSWWCGATWLTGMGLRVVSHGGF